MIAHCRGRGFIIEKATDSRWRVTSPAGTVEMFDAGQVRSLAVINRWEPPTPRREFTVIDGHEHDGNRRWAIYYTSELGNRCTFYSDALTMAGAHAHFARRHPKLKSTHVRRVEPDEWLTKR